MTRGELERRILDWIGEGVDAADDARAAVLASLEMVDAVVIFDDDTPIALIEAIRPEVLVKGRDWEDKGVVGSEWVESHGGQVVLAPLLPGRSTTAMLERARDGRVQATTVLPRPWPQVDRQ